MRDAQRRIVEEERVGEQVGDDGERRFAGAERDASASGASQTPARQPCRRHRSWKSSTGIAAATATIALRLATQATAGPCASSIAYKRMATPDAHAAPPNPAKKRR